MPLILLLETATNICSIALAQDSELLSFRETDIKNSHSEYITVFIDEALTEAGIDITSIDAIGISMGPGSYTGLRIGVSVAKGLCYALSIPLIAINTLRSMAKGAANEFSDQAKNDRPFLVPMIDARRMEVYSAIYDFNNNEIRSTQADIIIESSFDEYIKDQQLILFGNGAAKCKQLFSSKPGIIINDSFQLSSRFMIPLALDLFKRGEFENVAYFEPFYLKDFIAGKPTVKGLH